MSDLIERLREPCFERGLDETWIDAQRGEAADEITTLRARLADLETKLGEVTEERDELGRDLNRAKYGEPDFAWSTHLAVLYETIARAERAEQRLAEVEKERDQLAQINRNLCESHNTLLVDGSSWQARAERAEAALATARRDALEEAANRIDRKIKAIQPEMTRRAQRLAEGKRPGFQYAVHRADLDARISDRDMIRALITPQEPPTNRY